MTSDEKLTLTFHYIKTNLCVDHYVSGVYGGIEAATGRISMAVFAERSVIPKTVTTEFDSSGKVISETSEGKEGVVRSVSAVLHYDINTALKIRAWLDHKINAFKEAHPELPIDEAPAKDDSNAAK